MRDAFVLRLLALRRVRLLRRILRRVVATSDGPLEMIVGRLQIVLPRDGFAVADPGTDDVGRVVAIFGVWNEKRRAFE